jgi:hypothetical protein
MTLRISSPKDEGVYQASKWLKYPMLIDAEEMASLFEALGDFWIFPMTGVVEGSCVSKPLLLEQYGKWIEDLKQGKVPDPLELRRFFASVFIDDLSSLWLQPVGEKKFLLKIQKPVVQAQIHFFSYSEADEVFRSMSMGPSSIFWGIQFSFPQIYQDPKTMELLKLADGGVFRKIRFWMREHTLPTPFVVGKKRTISPIRLGKNCFSWIHQHPQLIEQNLLVET